MSTKIKSRRESKKQGKRAIKADKEFKYGQEWFDEQLQQTQYLSEWPALRLAIMLYPRKRTEWFNPNKVAPDVVWQLLALLQKTYCRIITLGAKGPTIHLRPLRDHEDWHTEIHHTATISFFHGDDDQRRLLSQPRQTHLLNLDIELQQLELDTVAIIHLQGGKDDLKWGRRLLSSLIHPCDKAIRHVITARAANYAAIGLSDPLLSRWMREGPPTRTITVSGLDTLFASGDARDLFEHSLYADLVCVREKGELFKCWNKYCWKWIVRDERRNYCCPACEQQHKNRRNALDVNKRFKHVFTQWKSDHKHDKKWPPDADTIIKWAERYKKLQQEKGKEIPTEPLATLVQGLGMELQEKRKLNQYDQKNKRHAPSSICLRCDFPRLAPPPPFSASEDVKAEYHKQIDPIQSDRLEALRKKREEKGEASFTIQEKEEYNQLMAARMAICSYHGYVMPLCTCPLKEIPR